MGAFYDSSMLAWIDALAVALLPRLGGTGHLSVRAEVGPGLDELRAGRLVIDQLRRRLPEVAISEASAGRPHLALTLSLEGGEVWAVGRLTGAAIDGALAVSWPVDRELEALLAAPHARLGQGRWALERLGTVPSGVLDLVLLDLEGDDGDEIAVLSVEGLRTLRFDDGGARPQPLGGPWPLGDAPHGRFATGWIAASAGGLAAATSAWAPVLVDPATGATRSGPAGPHLRQPPDPARPPSLEAGALDGADLRLADGADLPDGIPDRVRDLQLWPGEASALWVGPDGRLGGVRAGGGGFEAPAGPVGDRIVLTDLDRDGRMDLALTGAGGPGDPDRLSVHRLDDGGSPLIFEAGFDGSIAALAVGDLDFDGLPDLVLAEETGGDVAVLWRLERRR